MFGGGRLEAAGASTGGAAVRAVNPKAPAADTVVDERLPLPRATKPLARVNLSGPMTIRDKLTELAAGLALAARVEGLKVTLVEIDPALCQLAVENARLNGLEMRVSALALDAENVQALASAGLPENNVDRVLMNPPFNNATRQNVSPDPRRRLRPHTPQGVHRQLV